MGEVGLMRFLVEDARNRARMVSIAKRGKSAVTRVILGQWRKLGKSRTR
jgi:hypothetical protein